MQTQFPDGTWIPDNVGITQVLPGTSGGDPIITAYVLGQAWQYVYFCYSLDEQASFVAQITQAMVIKQDTLRLNSFAGLPTGGNTLATDMYINGSNTSPAAMVAGESFLLTIGTPSTNPTWPLPVMPVAKMVAAFLPSGVITIGGVVADVVFINGTTLQVSPPTRATGTYDLTYTDGRGTVTKTGCLSV